MVKPPIELETNVSQLLLLDLTVVAHKSSIATTNARNAHFHKLLMQQILNVLLFHKTIASVITRLEDLVNNATNVKLAKLELNQINSEPHALL